MAEPKNLPPNRTETDYPEWYDGKKVDEVRFCGEFLSEHPMICVKGSFFTVDGRITDEEGLRKQIYEKLSQYVKSGLPRRVDGLMNTLKVEAYCPDLPVQTDRIHVANGTLFLDGRFTEEKEYCRNRLPVNYNPHICYPPAWIKFLDQLLEADDICTLQEFMGYCLIPTTKAQKMLMIVGQGGEGKSRIGVVMRSIFGESMVNGSLAKVETNRPGGSGARPSHGGRRHEDGGPAGYQLPQAHYHSRASPGSGKEGQAELSG